MSALVRNQPLPMLWVGLWVVGQDGMGLNAVQAKARASEGRKGRFAAGRGVYLQVDGKRASWLLRYQLRGKARAMGLGSFDAAGKDGLTLAQARDRAAEAKVLIRGGIDPLAARQADAVAAAVPRPTVPTFRAAAEQFIAAQESGWRSAKHAAQWTATLATYAFSVIGSNPINAISTDDVLAILQPIWSTKPETAARVRGRIEAVLDAAKARSWREGENPARWKGHLALMLPKRSKVAAVEHHPALPWQEVPAFMVALAAKSGTAALALRFAILTAARSGEVRGMTWGEVELVGKLWTIPAARMKAGREHRVPLSDAALGTLHAARVDVEPAADALVFAARGGGNPLSDMALTMLLRKAKRPDGRSWTDRAGATITAHGFRSSFRDWAGEATAHPREVIEQALAHQLRDKAEAAYARGDLLAKRAALMADWARYCLRASGEVVALQEVAS